MGAWRSPGGTFGEPFVVARDRAVIDIVATGDEGVVISGQDSRGSVVTLLAAGSRSGVDQVLSSEQPPSASGARRCSPRTATATRSQRSCVPTDP